MFPGYDSHPGNNGYPGNRGYPGNPQGNEGGWNGTGSAEPAYGYGPNYGRGYSNAPLNDEIGGWISDWFSKSGGNRGMKGNSDRRN
jgi:hypothetical protein